MEKVSHSLLYIGKRSLYNLVFNKLTLEDKTAFFAFSIYRWLSDDRHANLDTHSRKDVFYKFAETVKNDNAFQKSLHDNYTGEDLRFFGTITMNTPGTISQCTGGSNRTNAYKTAVNFLSSKFEIPTTRSKTFENDYPDDYELAENVNAINLDNKRPKSPKRYEGSEYTKAWREYTGGYNKKAMIAVGICIVLCITPLWPIGLLLAIPSLLWLLIDTGIKIYKFSKHKKEMRKKMSSVNLN